jgi:hypothetical protein
MNVFGGGGLLIPQTAGNSKEDWNICQNKN